MVGRRSLDIRDSAQCDHLHGDSGEELFLRLDPVHTESWNIRDGPRGRVAVSPVLPSLERGDRI